MKFLLPLILILTGCANAISTKFTFTDIEGASLTVEMPKEMEAKNLVVDINAKAGTATIKADWIQSLNEATIRAQAERESAIAEKVTKAAVETAIKSLVPIP